jgi:hypothetical protein
MPAGAPRMDAVRTTEVEVPTSAPDDGTERDLNDDIKTPLCAVPP